ncbi:MAG: PAS domain S-box protein [Bacteroidetes bacterium]|nr:PAS domain S-box protein [Bacteroidota bacterium]
MEKKKPSYEELEQLLEEARATIEAMKTERGASGLEVTEASQIEGQKFSTFGELPVPKDFLTQRLITAFRAVKDLIWILDKDHRILWTNQASIEGLPCCWMLNSSPCFGQLHNRQEPIPGCPLERSKESLKREKLEMTENGRHYEITVDPILDAEGRFDGCVHVLSDITEAKNIQLSLERSENQFRWLAEKATDIIYRYEFKPRRGFTYVCPSATRITGYTPEEHYADPDLGMKLVHPDDQPLLAAYFENQGAFEKPLELRWIRKDGSMLWTEQRNVPVFDEKGDIVAIKGIARDITDRKLIELQQQELERKMQTIIENIDGLVYHCRFDHDWTMEYLSPACQKITGYLPEELINNALLSFNEVIHPDYREYCWNIWQQALPEKKTVELEYPIITKSGEERWVWERGCGIFDSQGNIVALEGFITDITGRRETEEQLRKLFRAVEQSPVSVVITDREGNIEYVNEKFTLISGYTKSEVFGQNPRILQSGIQTLEFYKKMWETITSGKVWSGELCNKKKNGELYWELAQISPVRGLNGEITHYVAVKEDITVRKRTNTGYKILYSISRLLHDKHDLVRFFESLRKELGQLYDINNFFAASYDDQNASLRKWVFYDENDDFDTWEARVSISGHVAMWNQTIFLKGEEIQRFSQLHNIPDTGTEPQCWLGVPIVANKKVVGVMVVQDYHNPNAFTDADKALLEMLAHETGVFIEKQHYISDLIKAKEKAEQSDKLKSAFLANMSHEIRTPMNGILGFAELLKAPDLSSEERDEYIALINKSGERMLNIINDIIDISRIEAGVVEVYPAETDLNEQLSFIYNFFKPQAQEKGLQLLLKNELRPGQNKLITDKEKLYAILTNLVKNAIKYTHQGFIELSCRYQNGQILFSVSDTGIGIPKDR